MEYIWTAAPGFVPDTLIVSCQIHVPIFPGRTTARLYNFAIGFYSFRGRSGSTYQRGASAASMDMSTFASLCHSYRDALVADAESLADGNTKAAVDEQNRQLAEAVAQRRRQEELQRVSDSLVSALYAAENEMH